MDMIDPKDFVAYLSAHGLDLWTGVPDSLLKDLCACASDALGERFVIAANEGAAVGAACGWYLATGREAVVYMQNSGEGNTINPLLSLADPDVYGIPMLLVIGWRGEPGVPDEPQHVKQGKVTLALLDAMGVPFEVLDPSLWETQVDSLLATMRSGSRPVALVVRKGVFSSHPFVPDATDDPLTREEALGILLDFIDPSNIVVSTTGKESRELFELREARGEEHGLDFLTVGGMGHTLSVAWGMALGQPERTVWCLDGDGSMVMHMGSLAAFGQTWPENLRYIVNVNGAHESVGGQPNAAGEIDVPGVLRACGLGSATVARTADEVSSGMRALISGAARAMVLHTQQGSRADLGRPTVTPQGNKRAMMSLLGSADASKEVL